MCQEIIHKHMNGNIEISNVELNIMNKNIKEL